LFKSIRLEEKIVGFLIHITLIFIGITMLLPFFWMLATSFKESQEVLQFPPTWYPSKFREFINDLIRTELWLPLLAILVLTVVFTLIMIAYTKKKTSEEEDSSALKKWLLPKLPFIFFTFIAIVIVGKDKLGKLFSNYTQAWVSESFGRYFFNSFYIACTTTFLQVLTSALAAYAFSFMNFPGRETIFLLFLGTMMIPAQALLIPDYLILSKLGWINTYSALIVPWCASVFGIFLLRQFFKSIPRSLYDAAKIDGCSRLGFFFRILLPLSVPPITTLSIFTFIGSWNSFLWALIVTHDKHLRTIQVGLAAFNDAEGTKYTLLMAASTFCILPLIIGFFFAQKQFIEGISRSGMKE